MATESIVRVPMAALPGAYRTNMTLLAELCVRTVESLRRRTFHLLGLPLQQAELSRRQRAVRRQHHLPGVDRVNT
ncbi:hypothetical protein AB0H00_20345 [Nocardia sp. NPDC023852]|uniref:hypothetical protein n=1 Tax=Nocardia sp. NPDC023852 TaxID=3154697 RepID=UPI0033EB1300